MTLILLFMANVIYPGLIFLLPPQLMVRPGIYNAYTDRRGKIIYVHVVIIEE